MFINLKYIKLLQGVPFSHLKLQYIFVPDELPFLCQLSLGTQRLKSQVTN